MGIVKFFQRIVPGIVSSPSSSSNCPAVLFSVARKGEKTGQVKRRQERKTTKQKKPEKWATRLSLYFQNRFESTSFSSAKKSDTYDVAPTKRGARGAGYSYLFTSCLLGCCKKGEEGKVAAR